MISARYEDQEAAVSIVVKLTLDNCTKIQQFFLAVQVRVGDGKCMYIELGRFYVYWARLLLQFILLFAYRCLLVMSFH